VENTIRFAKGEQLLPTLSGGDELAHLDDAFHNMTETITMQAREKQEFMAMISHDIRSPLTSVFGSMALLIEPRMGFNLPSEALNIVHRSQNNIDRLMRLINDLLDIEKFESGKMKMVYEITPMAYVIEQSVQALKTLADQKEIKLSATETNAEVFADGDRLVQVLVNLLSNALKYSPDNSTIKIAATEESSWLIVSVIDQGPGIPADYKDKMFQRFQQVDVAERRKYGGTGLGLAVCKEIVAAHNGTIGIDSEEGHGSTFWFRIPKNEETMLAAGNGQLEMQMKTG
jgi:signal transduction histidine kinase